MLLQEPTPEMIRTWKEIHESYRNKLKPDNKPIEEVISYLKEKYPVKELTDKKYQQIVIDNVIQNEYYKRKVPAGKIPIPKVFQVENTQSGNYLYENQDEQFTGIPIIVGFEVESGYFMVEGSSLLWDELFIFKGLDEDDLQNFYLVAEYVTCKKNLK